jgi:hypothetical protein
MPWMTHVLGLRQHNPRYRSHYFATQFDEVPVCGAQGLDTDNHTQGEYAKRCTKCDKLMGTPHADGGTGE